MTEEDKNLIRRLEGGDEPAFEIIYDLYYNSLIAVAQRILKDIDDARDVTQGLFHKLLEDPASFGKIHTNLKGWLKTRVKNDAIKYRKKYERPQQMGVAYSRPFDSVPPIEESPHWRKIEDALAQLTPRQRQVYTMRKIEGLRPAAIARDLRISVKTVKNTLVKANKRIAQILIKSKTNLGSLKLL
jgi:RNA polymerase sigma-70 factor, ECF subfamily